MKKLLLILLFVPLIGLSQISSFEFSKQRSTFPNQYIVLELDSISIESLYDKTLEWIGIISPKSIDKSRTFFGRNAIYPPKNTYIISIKNKIENLYIKMEGVISSDLECYYHNTYPVAGYTDVRYQIEFAFKENKVKFDVIGIEYYIPKKNVVITGGNTWTGWVNLNLNYSNMYKKNGKIHQDKLEETNRMIEYFNGLALSLYNYLDIPIKKEINNTDDW